jgi:hypothetical protein
MLNEEATLGFRQHCLPTWHGPYYYPQATASPHVTSAPPKLKARSAPFSAAAAAEPEQQEPQLPRFSSTVVLAFSSSVRYFYKGKTGPAPKVL